MDIQITYNPKEGIVCKNATGLVFFLGGEPPKVEAH
jgi:hypothetical protein